MTKKGHDAQSIQNAEVIISLSPAITLPNSLHPPSSSREDSKHLGRSGGGSEFQEATTPLAPLCSQLQIQSPSYPILIFQNGRSPSVRG